MILLFPNGNKYIEAVVLIITLREIGTSDMNKLVKKPDKLVRLMIDIQPIIKIYKHEVMPNIVHDELKTLPKLAKSN